MAINNSIKQTRWQVYLLEEVFKEASIKEYKYVFVGSFENFVMAVQETNTLSDNGHNVRLMSAPLVGPPFTEAAVKTHLNAQLEIYDEQLYILNTMQDKYHAQNE